MSIAITWKFASSNNDLNLLWIQKIVVWIIFLSDMKGDSGYELLGTNETLGLYISNGYINSIVRNGNIQN